MGRHRQGGNGSGLGTAILVGIIVGLVLLGLYLILMAKH